MSASVPTKRACGKCRSLFWDDGNTWCPGCDSASYAGAPGVLPDAPERVRRMREASQAELAERAALANGGA